MTDRQEPVDLPLEIEDPAHRALVSVWWTGILLKREARAFFKPLGSSEAHFNLLVILAGAAGPLTQKDLSRRLLVDKSNITTLVDGLEEAGLIRRRPVPEDRRRNHILLTAAGRRRAEELQRLYLERVERVMGALTPREHRQLTGLTARLRDALQA